MQPRLIVAALGMLALLASIPSAAEATIACDRFGCQQRSDTMPAESQSIRGKSVSLSGVVPELAAKARKIVATCGSRIISAVRRSKIAGTRITSLHAYGRAVDLQGNPGCIYRLLAGWQGGVSTDYSAVRHVHVSFAPQGREWGLRFRHARVGKRNIFRRYANRHGLARSR